MTNYLLDSNDKPAQLQEVVHFVQAAVAVVLLVGRRGRLVLLVGRRDRLVLLVARWDLPFHLVLLPL